ncbi:hypothetical protein F5X68DRAFT_67101 [Plectosphaerella plurivora]|uniref:RING-type domain-containing protein n=1 Tax=Plectosphaerella plurivora TaxID=936078 RepID=A0A9P8VI14_9PEZI|nr:hypothetical protein F5X68DRAFT_67101 [Plectosphaerella plurivora]
MGLQSLLGTSPTPSSSRPTSTSPSTADVRPAPPSSEVPEANYIHDDTQIRPPTAEAPDLRDLNNSLEALAAVFPDIQVEVFREMLANFDAESRLFVVADALLKNRVNWVKGRWRLADNRREAERLRQVAARDAEAAKAQEVPRTIPPRDAFRSAQYVAAVKALAWHEFRGLPRSTIHAVLAEHNYAYLDARRTLVSLSAKSWRFTFSTFFSSRRRPVDAPDTEPENHPLVIWRSPSHGHGHAASAPSLRATGCSELDREMYDALVRPLLARARDNQETADRAVAVSLHTEEAERMSALYECCCCFADATFEEFTQCNGPDGHLICFRCVRHAVNEAVFGQGWQSSINPTSGSLRCLAVDGGGCGSHVAADHLRRAMLAETKGNEILRRLDQRLSEHALLAAGLPLVRCPFCSYAEVDDIYLPRRDAALRLRLDSLINLVLLVVFTCTVPFLLPLLLLSTLLALILGTQLLLRGGLSAEWSRAIHRRRRRRRGPKFTCLEPSCARASCLSCQKSWTDIHVCNESSLVALRTQVEQAMSLAIKRVCPRCATSFVKNSGCNKLTCPCGYKMCYVCRKDIGEEGYRHYCDHFRPDGDPRPCRECDRCNLWETEDTEAVLRAAREDAERRWTETEKRELGGSEREFLATGFAAGGGRSDSSAADSIVRRRQLPSVAELCDLVVETLFA